MNNLMGAQLGVGTVPIPPMAKRLSWPVATVGQACVIRDDLRQPISREVRAGMVGPYEYYGPTGVLDHIREYRFDGRFALIGEDGDHFLKFRERSMTQFVVGKFNVNNHAH